MNIVETIQDKIKALLPPGTSCDKDIAMAMLMRDPDNFASLLNATDFFAEKILPEDLVERDSRLAALRFADMEKMKKKGQTLYRDVYKTWYGRYTFHVGLENASDSEPTLAVRNLNYDATDYHVQTAAKQKENRRKWKEREMAQEVQKDRFHRYACDSSAVYWGRMGLCKGCEGYVSCSGWICKAKAFVATIDHQSI